MNYYTHHIGDFNNSTRHLTRLERSIYRDLIDLYYESEAPLTNDLKRLCRLVIATSPEEVEVVEAILQEFFEPTENGWVQHRCQLEIENYQTKLQQQIDAGKASARARAKAKRTDAQRALNGRSTDAQPPKTQDPLPSKELSDTNVSLVASDAADCPHDEIRKVYAEVLPMLAQPKVWTGANQRNLRTRWREDAERQSVDWWRRFFVYVKGKPFLTGNNQRGWQADLGWLVKAENFAKVINGNFD